MKLEVSHIKTQVPFYSSMVSFLSVPVLRLSSTKVATQPSHDPRIQQEAPSVDINSFSVGSPIDSKVNKKFPLSQTEVVAVASIFGVFSGALVLIYLTMPDLDPEVLKIPKNLSDLQLMKEHISVYTKDYTLQVLTGYISTYIFMQTFMIPGTIFFSLLAGALFGVYKGVVLVVFSATAGASSCYFLSKIFGAPVAVWLWPEQIRFFRSEVAKRKGKLLNYMLFLRVTPTLPNTFINFASPIVDIPYHTFFFATLFGLVPASILSVRAGLTLGELESLSDLYDAKTLTGLFIIGLGVILPTILTKQSQKTA